MEAFIDRQRVQGLSPLTINRRLSALQHFYQFLADQAEHLRENPVRRTHYLRRPRALPRPFRESDLLEPQTERDGHRQQGDPGAMERVLSQLRLSPREAKGVRNG